MNKYRKHIRLQVFPDWPHDEKRRRMGTESSHPFPCNKKPKSTHNPSQTDDCYEHIVDKYKKKDYVTRQGFTNAQTTERERAAARLLTT